MTEAHTNTWVESDWIGFDTETTGISSAHDRIVTAAATRWENGVSGGISSQRTWLINPGVPIPERAAAIHKVTTEVAVQHGDDPATALEQINDVLASHLADGQAVVVFNASFDIPLLETDSRRHGVLPLSARVDAVAPIIDPLVLDRALDRYRRGKRTLGDVCLAYGVPVSADAHQADADTAMTLALLARILDKYPHIQELSTPELMDFQRQGHRTWAESMESYLRSKGRDSHISRTWI